MIKYPSIFNDVIGPVMRGPSSSHTAASWRAARMSMDILKEPLKKAIIDFDKNGAWAPNYKEQGTTLGIDGGLLSIEMSDDRMKDTAKIAHQMGVSIHYEINSFETTHVNTVRLNLTGVHGTKIEILAASLGGGSVEIRKYNGFDVKLCGDYYELLLVTDAAYDGVDKIKAFFPDLKSLSESVVNDKKLYNVKLSKKISKTILCDLEKMIDFQKIISVSPVVPVISGNETTLPFTSIESMLNYAEENKLDLAAIGLLYEKYQSGLEESEVQEMMNGVVALIENSINIGLAGTIYEDRILPQQSHLIKKAETSGKILQNSIINHVIANVSAIMESKSAMEVVVANPTAGSCGTVGGVLRAVADDMDASYNDIIRAYFAAGVIGVYFAKGPGFSAEEHGCQVECGASAGMAAAGIVQLFGGTAGEAIDAASLAIQNMIGLVCDPIADRVEAPCLGKNVSAAMNALSSATMVRAGYNALIPLNEVIETVSSVSAQMPTCVKCTGKGGLAITKTACAIKAQLSKH